MVGSPCLYLKIWIPPKFSLIFRVPPQEVLIILVPVIIPTVKADWQLYHEVTSPLRINYSKLTGLFMISKLLQIKWNIQKTFSWLGFWIYITFKIIFVLLSWVLRMPDPEILDPLRNPSLPFKILHSLACLWEFQISFSPLTQGGKDTRQINFLQNQNLR